GRRHDATTLVVDIGGGSTEFVVGRGDEVAFHVSTQVGVVRHSERHLHDDPPTAAQLAALRDDVSAAFAEYRRADVEAGIAVAGIAVLLETMAAFELDEITVSEHDILRGVALSRVARP